MNISRIAIATIIVAVISIVLIAALPYHLIWIGLLGVCAEVCGLAAVIALSWRHGLGPGRPGRRRG